MNGAIDDRVPSGRPVGGLAVPADRSAGPERVAAGPAAGGGPVADRQRRGGVAGDQSEHRAQGLPRARARRPGPGAARTRHVRHPHPHRQHAGRTRSAPAGPAPLARQGPQSRARRRKHRGPVPDNLSVRRSGGHSMSEVLQAHGLGKRYGRRWALTDCELVVPAGHVVGLVGPNGAGKSTLLNLAVGMITPTTGTVEVLGAAAGTQQAKVGYVAQDTPTYQRLSVADHLRLGARLNPAWDETLAQQRIQHLKLDPKQRAGKLSGGQRAQLALTLGLAKRPELLILDEPVASLDPLARREFLGDLMEAVAEHELSVILSSHLVSDLERVCDHLIVLVGSRVELAGDLDALLAAHHRLTGPRRDALPEEFDVISASHTDRQSTFI